MSKANVEVKPKKRTRALKAKGRALYLRDHVVLERRAYERLLEDLEDLAKVAAQRGEPTGRWEDLKRRLKKDGLL